jgi:NAD+ synthase (glutamine-hydrolysing)
MHIGLAQCNFRIGDIEGNKTRMLECLKRAQQEELDLLVFSELSICGYPPKDLLEFDDFILQCNNAMEDLALAATRTAVLVGAPAFNPSSLGKRLFNAAFLLFNGSVEQVCEKSLLPNYDVFDEARYFEAGSRIGMIVVQGFPMGITICEDIWEEAQTEASPEAGRKLYGQSAIARFEGKKIRALINLSASPFHYQQAENRMEVLQRVAMRLKVPVIYVNQVGAHAELIFDGGSQAVDAQGQLLLQLPYFEEALAHISLTTPMPLPLENLRPEPAERIRKALVMGISDYFKKMGFERAVLGLSGGIDSALVCALAVQALGKERVTALLLPSRFSSEHSISDSLQLVRTLGCQHHIVSIEPLFEGSLRTMEPYFKDLPQNLAEENMQARARGLILMAWTNKFNALLLNTTNKSEVAVGYGTLYGDLCGAISVIGDLYKTQVYALAQHLNQRGNSIPQNVITKAPSAELRPNQKDTDSLPDYETLDPLLFQYIECRKSARELVQQGFDADMVKRILSLVNRNEYKRAQTPPILRVSPKAFGAGRKMPIVADFRPIN